MKNQRKKAIAILAGLAVTGIVGASAASLGTVTGQSLGAATEIVASCDDSITVDYVTGYDAANDIVVVNTVNVTNVAPACLTLGWDLKLTGDTLTSPSSGAAPRAVLGTAKTGTVTGTSFSADYSAESIDAELVTGLVLTISG